MGRRRRIAGSNVAIAWALCASLLANAAPLSAQTDDENARRHFESGAAYLQQSDNENALREFQAAYALSKRPVLLLNIANVYERMGKLAEAIDALTKYLKEEPSSEVRTTTETRIANLQKRLGSPADSAAPAASAGSSNDSASASAASPAAPSPSPSIASPAPAPTTAGETSQPNRLPAYIALGVGGAAAIGAVVTGLIAKSKFDDAADTCKPDCPNSKIDGVKSMALVSDILTGVAVAGAATFAVLFFTAKSGGGTDASTTAGPSVVADFGPKGGAIGATWRF